MVYEYVIMFGSAWFEKNNHVTERAEWNIAIMKLFSLI